MRRDGIAIGKLVCKTTPIASKRQSRTSSPNATNSSPHWIVSLKGSDAEEDISERMLGRVVDRSTTTTDTSSSDGSTVSVCGGSVSSASKKSFGSHKKKSKSRKSSVTKKAHRSSKTQSKVAVVQSGSRGQRVHTTRATTRSAGSSVELFSGIEEIVIPPKPKVSKARASSEGDPNVIKVPMLTGTLYLYRDGPKRRAEFIRTK